MLLSELIRSLQDAMAEKGDHPVFADDSELGESDPRITFVKTTSTWVVDIHGILGGREGKGHREDVDNPHFLID